MSLTLASSGNPRHAVFVSIIQPGTFRDVR